ncbi:MAG: VOC family protein [Pseudolabrys sp.]
MSEPQPTLSLVTLGVADLARSTAFYEALGFARKVRGAQGVAFFAAGATAFAVWPLDELARDAQAVAAAPPGFRGVSLGWNCRSEAEADAIVERARRAGATVRKLPEKTSWGGYAGYFADPDGHLWEVVYNPGFPLAEDGRLVLPD